MSHRDVEQLCSAVAAGERPEFLFFWGHRAKGPGRGPGNECLSQWYPASFIVNGQRFATAEHCMMFRKAALFADDAAAQRILAADSPGAAKALGRSVRGFDEPTWEQHRFAIVLDASREKFAQNAPLRAFLLRTGTRVLVEASPSDRIWGIGLAADDARAHDPAQWRGLNLLGFALMSAREELTGTAAR